MIEDIRIGREHSVREPVLAHKPPDVLDRIELGRFPRQRQQRDIRRYLQLARDVPAGSVEQQHHVSPGRHSLRDLGPMQGHGLGRAALQHQAGAFALHQADRVEDISRRRSQVSRGGGTGAAPSPAPGNLVLLPDACLVGKPDLERLAISLLGRDPRRTRGKLFLITATAASLLA